MKVKATALDIAGEPHLIFTTTRVVGVGDEILFDYNDRQSRLSFLKSCPVCSNTTEGKQMYHCLT